MPDIYDTLVLELRDDPLGIGYAGMGVKEVFASLHAPVRPVPVRTMSRGSFLATVAPLVIRLDDKEPAIQKRWEILMLMLTGGDDTIDVSRPQIQGLLDVAVADKVMLPEERAALTRAGSRTVSRAEELGIPQVGDGHVESALKLIGG